MCTMTVKRLFGHNHHPAATPLGDIIGVESMLNATNAFASAMFFSECGLYTAMRYAYYQWTDVVGPLNVKKTITETTLLVVELGDYFAQKKELMVTND